MAAKTPSLPRSPTSTASVSLLSPGRLFHVFASFNSDSDDHDEERLDLQVLGLGCAARSPAADVSRTIDAGTKDIICEKLHAIPPFQLSSNHALRDDRDFSADKLPLLYSDIPRSNAVSCSKTESEPLLDGRNYNTFANDHSSPSILADCEGSPSKRTEYSGETLIEAKSRRFALVHSPFGKSPSTEFPQSPRLSQSLSRLDSLSENLAAMRPDLKHSLLLLVRSNVGIIVALIAVALILALLGLFAFDALPWTAWAAFGILSIALVALIVNALPAHVTMLVTLAAMLFLKIITPQEALIGFANTGVATVAVLFIVAEGIQRTSVLRPVFRMLLGKPTNLSEAQVRLLVPIALISAFLNNTPVVAMMIPVVQSWSRRAGFPISKLLMPLNNAAILGGTVTLLGTSTNLVVAGMASHANLRDENGGIVKLTVFGITQIGLVLLVVGLVYMIAFSRVLLVDRGSIGVSAIMQNPREYTVPLLVTNQSPIVGETVTSAGLRHLQGLYLVEVIRDDGTVIPAVSPETDIRAGDTLLFAGIVETVTELYLIPGLVPATNQSNKMTYERHERRLVELVISRCSSLTGKTPREAKFRSQFDSAIIAVHRRGEHVNEKIADIHLYPGDTLLVEAGENFMKRFARDSNFALVSEVSGSQPPRTDLLHMVIAAFVAIGMVVLATSEIVDILTAACGAAILLIMTGCLSMQSAADSVNIPVLLTIAASFGVSKGMEVTGAAEALAKFVVDRFVRFGDVGLLCGIYFSTAMLSAVITNNAAVALMFPVLRGILSHRGVNIYAALYVLMIGASSCFTTPISYQTNLMVHGPGGYTFLDWVVFGVPLQILLGVSGISAVNYFYPS